MVYIFTFIDHMDLSLLVQSTTLIEFPRDQVLPIIGYNSSKVSTSYTTYTLLTTIPFLVKNTQPPSVLEFVEVMILWR